MKHPTLRHAVGVILLCLTWHGETAMQANEIKLADAPPEKNTAQVTGCFIQLSGLNATKSAAWWQGQFQAMQEIGFDTVVVQYVAYDKIYFYPTKIPEQNPSEIDAIQFILDAAEKNSIEVFVGLQLEGSFWGNKFDLAARKSQNEATLFELIDRYGKHPAVCGWYLPEELSNHTRHAGYVDELLGYLGDMARLARKKTGKPVMMSPYFGIDPEAEAFAAWWDEVALPAICIDILALQDGVGTRRTTIAESRPPFETLAPVMKRHGVAFWANNESFWQTAGWPLDEDEDKFESEPTNFDHFMCQVKSTAPLVEKSITFEFTVNMNPTLPGKSAQLYQSYKDYYQAAQETNHPALIGEGTSF